MNTTEIQRLRKTGLLCLHCIRNLAYTKERREELVTPSQNQFWRTVDNNFLDMCVLEWCKLFADTNGKHHWEKIITDREKFLTTLFAELGCDQGQFENYIDAMKTYRDKFLAHLDHENTMNIPYLDKARKSVIHLYNYILAHEEIENCFSDAPDILDYFSQHSSEANNIYNQFANYNAE